jgi:uncharacterized membrane protein YfcA
LQAADLIARPELWLAPAQLWYREPLFVYPALAVAGLIAGVVNTIAGGGSFLTLPVFIYVGGLDPKIANGTNRVAVLPATIASSRVFHQHGLLDLTALKRILAPILVGVPLGAAAAIWLPQDAFLGVFGALFIAMAVFLCFNPKTLMNKERTPMSSRWGESIYFFGLGVYVGFLQAGYGLLMLVGLSVFHATDLVRANAVKNFVGAIVTIVALAAFVLAGQVLWLPGLTMAAGNWCGGLLGAKLAIKKGQRLIFVFLILVMLATGIKMLIDAIR